jgi:hypothetical protein
MSTDHDGYDLRYALPNVYHYQMVPGAGTREVSLQVSGRVTLFCNAKVCEFALDGSPPSNMAVLDHSTLTQHRITLHGRNSGRTALLAVGDGGKYPPLDMMVVSVKDERPITYNVHVLEDTKRKTRRTLEELNGIMQTVEKLYLKQANVRLHKVKGNALFIKDDLGDPIDVLKPPPISLRVNVMSVIKERLDQLGMTAENLNLVATWNLESGGTSLQGKTSDVGGRICLVQMGSNVTAESTTYAHEIGHALGLLHDDHSNDYMMNGNGQDSFRMSCPDIDRVNNSGTQ